MTYKVLCPWCGAEMKEHLTCASGGYPAWLNYKCKNIWCSAVSPYGDTREEAYAKALRRYTPPIKPMTWDEVAAMPEMCWYERVEGIEYPILPMAVHGGALKFAFRNGTKYAHTEGYNRVWRCWSR